MRRSFIMRKKLDDFLHWLMPRKWVPLYNSVTFSDMGYSKCITNRKWQDKVKYNTRFSYNVIIFLLIKF